MPLEQFRILLAAVLAGVIHDRIGVVQRDDELITRSIAMADLMISRATNPAVQEDAVVDLADENAPSTDEGDSDE
jgi:hypothetical protein